MPEATEGRSSREVIDLAEVNALGQKDFVQVFGGLFEHSPWVAERAALARPFKDAEQMLAAMEKVLLGADREAQLALIMAHPELAARRQRARDLTEHSTREQSGAGLDACTQDEAQHLAELNKRYREKFGFPCIVAVKGLGKEEILARLAARIENENVEAFDENLRQILRIARFRLAEILAVGKPAVKSP